MKKAIGFQAANTSFEFGGVWLENRFFSVRINCAQDLSSFFSRLPFGYTELRAAVVLILE